jgi:AraC-like DNA-binding protein
MRACPAKKVCEQKERLLQRYESAVTSYSAALTELAKKLGILSKEEFNEAFKHLTEVVIQGVAAARIKLQAHIREHHC